LTHISNEISARKKSIAGERMGDFVVVNKSQGVAVQIPAGMKEYKKKVPTSQVTAYKPSESDLGLLQLGGKKL
jgi:hypothetical protein